MKVFIDLNFSLRLKALVSSLTVSSDNRFIISGSHDKSIKIFEVETKKQIQHFKDVQDSNFSSFFSVLKFP